jgi:hypothetical protein
MPTLGGVWAGAGAGVRVMTREYVVRGSFAPASPHSGRCVGSLVVSSCPRESPGGALVTGVEPQNLVLEMLRAIRSDIARLGDPKSEALQRLSRIEPEQMRMRRDQGSDAEGVALIQLRIDRMRTGIDRIKRRLDTVD